MDTKKQINIAICVFCIMVLICVIVYITQTREENVEDLNIVVYKYDEQDRLRLKGCQFWNIPYNDLEGNVKNVWMKTQRVIKEGIHITVKNGRKYNNLPKASDNPVCHVRPHALNAEDTYELPNGEQFPKQCFWLNNSYILMQLRKDLF